MRATSIVRNQSEITGSWDYVKPLISIICLTYNHEKFINQTLDGFLSQETSFPIEIVVRDDCSVDTTRKIIESYVAAYPQIIKPIFSESQLWPSRHVITEAINACNGTYLAFCEGDDYWIDHLKINRQASFLEENQEYGLAAHRSYQVQHNTTRDSVATSLVIGRDADNPRNTLPVCHTSSLLVRRSLIGSIPKWFDEVVPKDIPIMALATSKMKSRVFPEIASVYRIHSRGLSQNSDFEEDRLQMLKVVRREIPGMHREFDRLIGFAFSGYIYSNIRKGLFRLAIRNLLSSWEEVDLLSNQQVFLMPRYLLLAAFRRLTGNGRC